MHKHHRISDKQYADAKKINLKANLVERTKKNVKLTVMKKIQSMIHMLTLFNQN